jgi:RNase P subunit RPR2
MISSAIVVFLAALFIAALVYVVKRTSMNITHEPRRTLKDPQRFKSCPLCGSSLIEGENIVSRIYTNESGSDKPCTIHGCPHCYPKLARSEIVRMCPVCNKVVPVDGHLLARIFYRSGQKQHVHVVGCSECHKKK